MRAISFTFAILIGILSIQPLSAATSSRYHQAQIEADRLYDAGEYQKAMKQYLTLAKKGDSFSQYRVSYMYLEGKGQEEDLIESFAWASLAAQNRQSDMVKYRDAVGSLIPEKQHRKALRRVDYYTRKWGNLAIADNVQRGTRQELRNCTGSRLGTRCEEVYAMEMPKFWGINPGNGGGSGGDGGSAAPSGSVASAVGNGGGGAQLDMAYYQQLRSKIREMNRYIEENTGKVELGEFEVLEDQPAPSKGEDSR